MRLIVPRRAALVGSLLAATVLVGVGASKPRKPTVAPLKPLKVDETIGKLARVETKGEVKVEGVGLVVGLSDTGSDPEPSYYRDKLLDQMRKAGVENSDKILNSTSSSLVIVRASIPSGVATSDRLDAEIELTQGSTTKSLAGGWLIASRLTEVQVIKGGAHEGSTMAVAGGPVMIGTAARPNDPKVARLLGGCRVKKEMPFALVIDKNYRSIRTATRLQSVINERFHQHEGVNQAGMATAKTDEFITLKVPKNYHQNQLRYFQVIMMLPVVNTPALLAQRMEKWGKELLDPKKAGVAALKLEGIGPNSIEVLKQGLASDNDQVRFFSAEALAYLDDPAGVDVLAETVLKYTEFRTFALAALAAMDQPAATLRLRKLMDESDTLVRYGAFNALRTQDEHDPFLGKLKLMDEEEKDPAENDSTAWKIAPPRRRERNSPSEPFSLYVVDCEGPPLVHVTGSRRCEIVVFGRGQKLLTPVVLGNGGSILLNAALGDAKIEISRIVPTKYAIDDRKVAVPLALGDVIREAAQLGATYPEIVSILVAADRQKNLAGPLVVDAVSGVDPKYDEALLLGVDATAKKDKAVEKTKNEEPKRKGFWNRLFDGFSR
jgi:flagellar basal body P-ring protein FlgI